MKRGSFSLFLLIQCALVFGQGIQFLEGSWKDALAEAKKVGKPIFVDSYTQWCGPCKAMAKNVFTQDQVGKFFNENFVNYKLDMETPEGKSFESTYPVSAYPTLFFIDEAGKVIKKVIGGQQAEGLIAQGREALKGAVNVEEMTKLYDKGNREYDFIVKYVKALSNQGKPSLKISNDYLNSAPPITEDQKMQFIFEAAVEADSKLFENLVKDKERYIKLVGEDKYNAKVKSACKATIEKAIEYETPTLLTDALNLSDKALTKDATDFRYSSEMFYHKSFKNKDAYLKSADNYYKTISKDEKKVISITEEICKTFKDDPKVFKKASDYAANLYKTNKSFENLNFYCNLLANANELDAAIKVAESAFKESKKITGNTELHKFESLVTGLKSKKA
jgi:thiol-disulfide isomerase/thioredoxin